MKIKSKILLNSFSFLVIILLIGGLFLFSINESTKENEKNEVANRISKNILELSLVTNEYINERGKRSKEQWHLKYENSYQNLDSSLFKERDEIEIFKRIKEKHEEIRKLFLQISSEEVSNELREKVRGQLSIKSQSISSESFELSHLLRDKVKKSQRQSIFIFIFLTVLSIVIGLLINSYIVKSILTPMSYIAQLTKEIESGNFRARVNINTGDEIEELGMSFNKTMEELEKLEIKREELEHAKTEFLSVTSHELRSPMTPMRAQLQMLKEEYYGRLNSKQYASVDIVLRNTERLDRIIMDLLEISRIEAARLKFNFVKVNLGENLMKFIDEISGFLIDKNIQLIPKIGRFPVFECDPDRIMQVLRNLVENALKFSKKNGRIIITVERVGDFIQFSVKDFGIGVSKENQKRLFEPFFQGEKTMYRKYGGTGLGLSICKGIVESQGGKIWFKSQLGVGSEFFFTFPLKPVKAIKPIKLMFSSSIKTQNEIVRIFKEFLGPIAIREIETLKEGEFNYKKITEYIETLENKNILDKEISREFKTRVAKAFGEYQTSRPELKNLMEIGKRRRGRKAIIQEIILMAYKLYGDVAIRKANSVAGLRVSKRGKVLSLAEDEKEVLRLLGITYIDLMGDLTRFLEKGKLK
jgi:signal transduction histidine kinase